MKKAIHVLAILFLCLGISCAANAGSGHYVSGVEGIKAATLPPPGFYWRLYNVFYNADEMRDENGDKAAMDFEVSVYCLVNRFVYSSEIEILGGNVVADLCIPLISTDISMKAGGQTLYDDNESGLGDVLVEPFILAWHGPRYDLAAGVGVYLPVGNFDKDRIPSSPGKGFWTGMLTAGATWYFDDQKTWSASILSRYETHSEQQDTEITYGDDFHFEWGLGRTLAKVWDVGLAGYCRWQVTDDSGPGTVDDRERAFAAGPEVSTFIPSWGLGVSLRSLWEFENRENSQGNITTLLIMKAF